MEYWQKEKIFLGFTDQELQDSISRSVIRSIDRKLGEVRVPALFWTSEIYSFGKCFRKEVNWPKLLPLPFYSDHGVCLLSEFQPHETQNRAKYHMTWFEDRYECLRKNDINKSVVRITHPWVTYRRNMNYRLSDEASGTMIFYSHTNNGIDIEDFDDDQYFDELKSLPDDYHPLVICLHQHDIVKGIHEKLRKYNLPIITMGNTSSTLFVDRFYNVLSNFKHATSTSGGTDLFIATEFGVDYFILGRKPKYVNHSHKENPIGVLDHRADAVYLAADKEKRRLFSFGADFYSEKISFCDKVLGLNNENVVSLKNYRNTLIVEMIKLAPLYIFVVMKGLVKRLL